MNFKNYYHKKYSESLVIGYKNINIYQSLNGSNRLQKSDSLLYNDR